MTLGLPLLFRRKDEMVSSRYQEGSRTAAYSPQPAPLHRPAAVSNRLGPKSQAALSPEAWSSRSQAKNAAREPVRRRMGEENHWYWPQPVLGGGGPGLERGELGPGRLFLNHGLGPMP